ncbi:regulatory protein, luxR family [Nocardioides exalbidus]|uniref:Regulatory protein, luxR family n=1 Tax=Nocardioides exalbidus TaxID=402596 RepID=A0A1H4YA51_9ACTN|nr:regulatory protein, luxR family [Nocardioides exalbidus]
MRLGDDVSAKIADLVRGSGGVHHARVTGDAQLAYVASLEEDLTGRDVHLVHASPGHPLSVYQLVQDTQPSAADAASAVVVCIREPSLCDATTRVLAELRPADLGSVPVLWVVIEDPPAGTSAESSSTTPPASSTAPPDAPHHDPRAETVLAAGAALGRRFTLNEVAASLGQPAITLLEAVELSIDSGVLRAEAHELVFASDRAWRAVRSRQEPGTWARLVAAGIESHTASRKVGRLRELLVDGELDDVDHTTFERLWDVLAQADFLAGADLCRRRAARATHTLPEAGELEARTVLLELQSGRPGLIEEYAAKLGDTHPTALGAAIAEALMVPYPLEAMELALRTLDAAEPGTADHARLHALVVTCRALIGDVDLAQLDLVTATATATGDPRARSMADFARAVAIAADGDPLAVLRIVALGSEYPANQTLGPMGWLSGTFRAKTLVDLGRIAESEHVIDSCADYVERRGQVAALPHVIMSRAVFAMEQGRLIDAAHGLLAARHIGLAIGLTEFSEANILSRLIQLARMRGDTAELVRLGATLENHLEDERTRLDAVATGLTLANDLLPAEWTPRWASAPSRAPHDTTATAPPEAMDQPESGSTGYSILLALHDVLATLRSSLLNQGDQSGGLAMLTAVARTTGLSFPSALASHAVGLASGEAEGVAAAMTVYRDLHRPLLQAQALEDLGYLAQDRAGSIAALEEARRTWQSVGATREAARMDRYLRSLGSRSAPAVDTRRALDLTAAEERVVRELQAGRSNADIAEALQISRNTVAVHLSRIYARFGVASRGALIELVQSLERADR